MDSLLRLSWESSANSFNRAVTSTCVARNLGVSCCRSTCGVAGSETEILDLLWLNIEATTYVAHASVETVRITARSMALIDSLMRVVWMKAWGVILTSKFRLSGIPFDGVHPFLIQVEGTGAILK